MKFEIKDAISIVRNFETRRLFGSRQLNTDNLSWNGKTVHDALSDQRIVDALISNDCGQYVFSDSDSQERRISDLACAICSDICFILDADKRLTFGN